MSAYTVRKKRKSKYTEDWIPIKDISNGIITLDDKTLVSGIKIMPKNIFILDEDVQNMMLSNLRNFYNSLDFEFWIICADRPVDVNVYLSQLQLLYNSTQSPETKKMITEDIEKANMFMNNNVVDTEYYLLIKERNSDLLRKKIRNMINGLASANLNSAQVNNDDLRVLLDNFFNGGQTTEFGTVMSA